MTAAGTLFPIGFNDRRRVGGATGRACRRSTLLIRDNTRMRKLVFEYVLFCI